MVSIRCKMMVREELKKLRLHYAVVELGSADIVGEMSKHQVQQLRIALQKEESILYQF